MKLKTGDVCVDREGNIYLFHSIEDDGWLFFACGIPLRDGRVCVGKSFSSDTDELYKIGTL